MELSSLISGLPAKKHAVYTLEQGKPVRHPHAVLFDDVMVARDDLRRWGVKARARVGIYAPNSYRWLVYDLALIAVGAISVPFTDDFAGSVNATLVERYNISLLLLSKTNVGHFAQKPAFVAFIDGDNENVQALERPPSGDSDEADQHSLVFSSGSAGGLKGLVISRKGVEATLPPIMEAIGLERDDRLLLFLPMSNFQQRNMCYAALWYDFDIIIADYTQLFSAMKTLNPTILVAPPVFFQMMHGEFTRYPAWKRSLRTVLGSVLSLIPVPALRRILARWFFPDFHGQFGSGMRVLLTGMAPIRRNIAQFFHLMQLPLSETYGLVEAGSLTYRPPHSSNYESVGKPVRDLHISFESDGEIIVSRENPLTLRYFQCAPGENERTFVAADKIATGDIGRLDKDGNVYLLGRKKELIVTSGGYKVHPEIIEEELNNCPEVAQSVIFLKAGASHLTCVVALNEPNNDEAKKRARKFIAEMKTTKKATQFVETIFAEEPFSLENGMLRPNLKIDRKRILARYNVEAEQRRAP